MGQGFLARLELLDAFQLAIGGIPVPFGNMVFETLLGCNTGENDTCVNIGQGSNYFQTISAIVTIAAFSLIQWLYYILQMKQTTVGVELVTLLP